MSNDRVVCLNCMDGRVQLPVIEWIKANHNVDYVDMITEPGMDGLLSNTRNSIDDIKRKIEISIIKNHSSAIFIVGHHDCKGNPADDAEHHRQILSAVGRIKNEIAGAGVTGLWVNKDWTVEPVEPPK